jgi:FAD synthetase
MREENWYFLPGGHVDFKERVEDSLIREIKEELGISVRIQSFIGAVENIYTEKKERHHEINLVFNAKAAKTTPKSKENHIEFTLKDIESLSKENILPESLKKALAEWLQNKKVFWRGNFRKKRKVLVFGTFDGVHSGHLNFFKQAQKYGDYLIVVVARDDTVKKIKGNFPFRSEEERVKDIQECKIVNEVKLGSDKSNPYKILKVIKPDVICLGYDQKVFTENLPKKIKELKLKTKIFRMKPYKTKRFHSSIIRKSLFS